MTKHEIPLPPGPTTQQNPMLIADAMGKQIVFIGQIMLKRINDPTYIAPKELLEGVRVATIAMGNWSMSVSNGLVAADCTIQQAEPDGPAPVLLTMNVYGHCWKYMIFGDHYEDLTSKAD